MAHLGTANCSGGAKSQSRGVYVFAHILDVRYNDDRTGQALLDRYNLSQPLRALHAAHTSSAYGGSNKVVLSRWCGTHFLIPR